MTTQLKWLGYKSVNDINGIIENLWFLSILGEKMTRALMQLFYGRLYVLLNPYTNERLVELLSIAFRSSASSLSEKGAHLKFVRQSPLFIRYAMMETALRDHVRMNRPEILLFPLRAPIAISRVACGNRHTVVLSGDGKLYACGDNSRGQLGVTLEPLGRRSTASFDMIDVTPRGLKVTMIACGPEHTVIHTTTDGLYASGDNRFAQLGFSNDTIVAFGFFRMRQEKVRGEILEIQCNQRATFVLTTYGLYGCGQGAVEMVYGHDNEELKARGFFLIEQNAEVNPSDFELQRLGVGAKHVVLLQANGRVNALDRTEVYSVTGPLIYGTGDGQRVVDFKRGFDYVMLVPQIKALWCSANATIYQLQADGDGDDNNDDEHVRLVCFGVNENKQLGSETTGVEKEDPPFEIKLPVGTNSSDVHLLVTTTQHTMIALKNNRLFVGGSAKHGQLGIPPEKYNHGGGGGGETDGFVEVTTNKPPGKIISLAAGPYHTVILTTEGFFATGNNEHGQLGLGKDSKSTVGYFTEIPGVRV